MIQKVIQKWYKKWYNKLYKNDIQAEELMRSVKFEPKSYFVSDSKGNTQSMNDLAKAGLEYKKE